jgi:hypothetical protein
MHGPYYAKVKIGGEEIRLDANDVGAGVARSYRYYNSGIGVGLRLGFTRAAALALVDLVEPGQRADVEIVGRIAGKETVVGYEMVRRDEAGRAFLSLGSSYERYWKGL